MTCRCNCPDYKTHIKGVAIGGFPTQTTYSEKKLEMDRDAFKRLVDDGLNPGRLNGAYVMERSAKNEREITMGRALDSETHRVFDDAGV
jgi:hypothetical protein